MRPHPFAWLLLGALVLAITAAALAPDRAPAVALYWNPIYRAEIALVVLAIAYLLGVVGWMAWHGHAFQRIELPGGAASSVKPRSWMRRLRATTHSAIPS